MIYSPTQIYEKYATIFFVTLSQSADGIKCGSQINREYQVISNLPGNALRTLVES